MRVASFFLADSLAIDSTAAITAVRLGQNIIRRDSLPSAVRRSALFSVFDGRDEATRGRVFDAKLIVVAPSGLKVVEMDNQIVVEQKEYEDIPMELLLPAIDLMIPLPDFGEYRFIASMTDQNSTRVEAELSLHVRHATDVMSGGMTVVDSGTPSL
jgi:hypothetical protein